MGSAVLGEAISAIRDWSVTEAMTWRGPHATETFGSLVFGDQVQQQRLPATRSEGPPRGHAENACYTRAGLLMVSTAADSSCRVG
jgi:hypothetical protein